MFAVFHVAGTVLQVALALSTDNKDGIIDSPANFNSFGATLSGPEVLSERKGTLFKCLVVLALEH